MAFTHTQTHSKLIRACTHTRTHTDGLGLLCVRPIHFATSGPRLDLVRVPLHLTLADLKLPLQHPHKRTFTHAYMHTDKYTQTAIVS